MTARSDAIVIGAGHNGLVAACYLGQAGLDVTVLEANDWIGGCTTTAALVPEAPEHLLNPCAADIITLRASTVVADLELERFGFRQVEIDPSYLMLMDDGSSLAFWRDPNRTAREIRRFSEADARAFLALMEAADHVLDASLPLIATNPTRPDPARVMRALRAGLRHPRSAAFAAVLTRQTAEEAIRERFSHPTVRSMVATITNFGSPITGPGTAVNMLMLALIARFGMGRPLGGMGALPSALERCLVAHGGRVRTGARVAEVLVHGGTARGVRLQDGEEIACRTVLAATEPHQALARLLPPGSLSERHAARAERIPCSNDGCTHFKVEMALKGRLRLRWHERWRGDGLDPRMPSSMAGSIDDVCGAIGRAQVGRVPDPIPFVA